MQHQEQIDTLLRSLPILRSDILDLRSKTRMCSNINLPVSYRGACRVLAEKIVTLPVFGWSNRSGLEATSTVWANIAQDLSNAICTEGAFVTANTRLKRVRRQCLVAVFTGWSEFQHFVSFCLVRHFLGDRTDSEIVDLQSHTAIAESLYESSRLQTTVQLSRR